MEKTNQEIRKERLATNLITQVDKVFRDSNSKSIETRYTYWETSKRFVTCVAEIWGVQSIKNLRAEHVQGYINQLKDDDCTVRYMKTEMSGIRHLFRIAECRHTLPENNDAFVIPKRESDIQPGATKEEYEAIRAIALASGNKAQVISVDMMYHLGMRINESQATKVRYIRDALEVGVLHLDKGAGTKGGRPRDIPIQTPEQLETLKEVMRFTEEEGKTLGDRIANDREHGAVHKAKAALERLFVNNKDKTGGISPHDLRRAFAQNLYDRASGSDAERMAVVCTQLGHGSGRKDITACYVANRHAR